MLGGYVPPLQLVEDQEGQDYQNGSQDAGKIKACSHRKANSRHCPEACRGGEAADVGTFPHDRTCTEETDAAHHLRGDASRFAMFRRKGVSRNDHDQGGAHAD